MTNRTVENAGNLSKGQIWRTRAAEIQILGLANEFVHYTVTSRIGPRRTTAQVSSIEPMANYLKLTRARLVSPVERTNAEVDADACQVPAPAAPVRPRLRRGFPAPLRQAGLLARKRSRSRYQ